MKKQVKYISAGMLAGMLLCGGQMQAANTMSGMHVCVTDAIQKDNRPEVSNTIDTTVHFRKGADGKPDTFVYTGDIHAMWLRDSGAQVWPYVQLANSDPELKEMLAGVILRQFKCINIDPYANAFNDGAVEDNHWMSDLTDMKPELHERKWEIDSLCYPLRLAYHYWKTTGDASIFSEEWIQAITNVLKTFKEQQRKDGVGPYKFQRKNIWYLPISLPYLHCAKQPKYLIR